MLFRSTTLHIINAFFSHLAGHVEIRIELGNLLDCAQREPEHLPNLLLFLFRAYFLKHTHAQFFHWVRRSSVGCGLMVRPSSVGCGLMVRPSSVGFGVAQLGAA
jgi:hypothetical protein